MIMLHRYLNIEDRGRRLHLADEGLRRSSAWELKLDLFSLEINAPRCIDEADQPLEQPARRTPWTCYHLESLKTD